MWTHFCPEPNRPNRNEVEHVAKHYLTFQGIRKEKSATCPDMASVSQRENKC